MKKLFKIADFANIPGYRSIDFFQTGAIYRQAVAVNELDRFRACQRVARYVCDSSATRSDEIRDGAASMLYLPEEYVKSKEWSQIRSGTSHRRELAAFVRYALKEYWFGRIITSSVAKKKRQPVIYLPSEIDVEIPQVLDVGFLRSRRYLFDPNHSKKDGLVKFANSMMTHWWTNQLREDVFWYLYNGIPVEEEEWTHFTKDCPVSLSSWSTHLDMVHVSQVESEGIRRQIEIQMPASTEDHKSDVWWVKCQLIDPDFTHTPHNIGQLYWDRERFEMPVGVTLDGFREPAQGQRQKCGHLIATNPEAAPSVVVGKRFKGMALIREINGNPVTFHQNLLEMSDV